MSNRGIDFFKLFSELMFFVCFFGSLFYVRVLVGPWLDGEAAVGWFDDTATDAAIANANGTAKPT